MSAAKRRILLKCAELSGSIVPAKLKQVVQIEEVKSIKLAEAQE